MSETFWLALALVFILEGFMPFLFPKQWKEAWRNPSNSASGKMGKGLGGAIITLLGFCVAGGVSGSLWLMPAILGLAWLGFTVATVGMNSFNIGGSAFVPDVNNRSDNHTHAGSLDKDTPAVGLPNTPPEGEAPRDGMFGSFMSFCRLGRGSMSTG